MLRSSNPILSRQDAFTPGSNQGYGQAGYGSEPQGYQGYGGAQPPTTTEGRMTFDDVITKSVITIGLVIASAALMMYGLFTEIIPHTMLFPALIVSGLVGFVTVLLVSFRRKVSPPLVLAYSVIEGVFVGALSFWFEMLYPGIVVQAVLGTFAAAGVTLAAYKIFNIRVTPKFQKIVILATIGFAVAIGLNFVLALFGINLGLRDGGTGPVSLLAVGISLLGAVLAVLNLVLDFDHIERGVAMGAPASESWRGAFGLTVTMVWLYIEILRLLSYLRR
ncbi:Bax inhibitor-1/YccA family protein [Microlunatus parietis]|uniref:Putative YccA/Bax inhibitor family protein n=1 Tax=Microlunatus parietis TaxID=682979 RepID=A0A7Y9I534_9ACTN|nr:Bax inhibitor-1/YccA family protein [Microlunatus parietis]NYE70466.1 putative YccA/Bax inhibitor family protein [Microlunatus parietis]